MWEEMFKGDYGEISCAKCILCLAMKGKDVIFNLEFSMLEKHARKMKVV
jgi:hypothetical protein